MSKKHKGTAFNGVQRIKEPELVHVKNFLRDMLMPPDFRPMISFMANHPFYPAEFSPDSQSFVWLGRANPDQAESSASLAFALRELVKTVDRNYLANFTLFRGVNKDFPTEFMYYVPALFFPTGQAISGTNRPGTHFFFGPFILDPLWHLISGSFAMFMGRLDVLAGMYGVEMRTEDTFCTLNDIAESVRSTRGVFVDRRPAYVPGEDS